MNYIHEWYFQLVYISAHSDETYWPPLPEPDTAEEEEASNLVLSPADHRAREAVSQTEILGVGRAVSPGQAAENDRRPGEDLVSEQEDEMEVSSSPKLPRR